MQSNESPFQGQLGASADMLGALSGPDWQGTANRALLAVTNNVSGEFEKSGMTPRQFIQYYSTNANSEAGKIVYRAALATVAKWDRDRVTVDVPPVNVFPVSTGNGPVYVPPVASPPVGTPTMTPPVDGPYTVPRVPMDTATTVARGASSPLLALAGVGVLAFLFMRR
jgi:hypothetical protein